MSAFPKSFRCAECNARLEVIDGEEVEPCLDCIAEAKRDAVAAYVGKSPATRREEAEMERTLEELRREYLNE